MKINEHRSQNISGAKVSGRLKDVLGVFDKITLNSAEKPDLSIYGRIDFSPSHGTSVSKPGADRWILDGMIEAGHGSGTTPSPGSSHNNPCNGHPHGTPPCHTPGSTGHIPGSVPGVYNRQFNDVMDVLNNISYQSNNMNTGLSYAGNNINASKEELKSTYGTIEEVKNDTGEKDSSPEGDKLDAKMTSVEYKLQEGDRYIDSARNDFNAVRSCLNDASNRIDYLKSQLQSAGPYQQVISYLDQAKQNINNSLSNASSVDYDLHYVDGYMNSAAGEVGYARSYIRAIKGDYDGNDVSSDAYSVETYVSSAERSLDNANSELSGTTGSYLPSLSSGIEQAISSLKYAQSIYNSIR